MSGRSEATIPGADAPAPPLAWATLLDDSVTGWLDRAPAGLRLALLVDGQVVASAPAASGAFSIALPDHALGRALEVLRTDTGANLLAEPANLAAHRGFRWRGLVVRDGRAEGAFWLAGSAPVLVELLDGERIHTRGFSAPGRQRHRFALALPPPGKPLLLTPRVGGMRLPAASFVLSADAATAEAVGAAVLGFLDGVEGLVATGWACNLTDPASPLLVEALCDGRVIGTGRADLHRGDVAEAGLPTPRCGFRLRLDGPLAALIGRDVSARVQGASALLPGSPARVRQNPNIARLLGRDLLPPALLARLSRRMAWQTRGDLLTIVMPVHDTPRAWLAEALLSVRRQWCSNWELVCVDDGSTAPHVGALLAEAAADDPRIRVLRSPKNLGIARAVNFGLRAARGAWVAFLDHDDALEPDAVHAMLTAARATGADLLYSDEAVTTERIDDILEVRARPAFSHDFYLSHPYFVHLVCVRTALAQGLAGYDEGMAISADVDFVLRALERARRVAHVPRVLYRWRTHGGSTGHARQASVMAATREALQRHLDRLSTGATAADGAGFNRFRVDWPDDPEGEILVVVPTRNRVDLLRACIESVERTCAGVRHRLVVIDHASDDPATLAYLAALPHTVMRYAGAFNYAAMNNAAVRAHAGNARYLLLLNNDVEAIKPGWMPRLRSLAARSDVGAVGCQLLYGDGRVQHGGVIVGFRGAADHVAKLVPGQAADGARTAGYNSGLVSVRDYSAVTAACMMLKRAAFEAVGGFDEGFAVGFNDTDLCLRLRAAGHRVLYDGMTALLHHESLTRTERGGVAHPKDDARLRRRWPEYFTEGDPFYSPLLNGSGIDHALRADRGCKGRLAPRVTDLNLRSAPPPPAPAAAAAGRAARRRPRAGAAARPRLADPPADGASG